jgi:uncharacterized protein YbcC (UPF0753/DUF2309 family)
MEKVEQTQTSATERMRLLGLIRLASEIIAPYWPMRAFVHHNPLHGLERLHFDEAVRLGEWFLGGKGYLAGSIYRQYFHSGRILPAHLDAALRPLAQNKSVSVWDNPISHFDTLRACLIHGMGGALDPDKIVIDAPMDDASDRSLIEGLADHLAPSLTRQGLREQMQAIADEEEADMVRCRTLSASLDRVLGTHITGQINDEIIKWLAAFLDEGQAAWPMPDRENGFYLAWKSLVSLEKSHLGILDSSGKLADLPAVPQEAIMMSLNALGVPRDNWQDYLTLHLTALPGWSGLIKWRAYQVDYDWQDRYPVDLSQYLAVRLWYERELVERHSQEALGLTGNLDAISSDIHSYPEMYALRRKQVARILPASLSERVDLLCHASPDEKHPKEAWKTLADQFVTQYGHTYDGAFREAMAARLVRLAQSLKIDPAALLETDPAHLTTLLDWMDAFGESEQGPVWLMALEDSYRASLLASLMPNFSTPDYKTDVSETEQQDLAIRPQAQAVFCIDVRSEPLRRHLEAVGDYETFGFAGFFSAFIRYRAWGDHHDTDQFPAIMKSKNEVREIPRTYQNDRLPRYHAGTRMLRMLHTLFHDLKENVVTPYVMVEMIGWFYALPLIGKTVAAGWYQTIAEKIRHLCAPPIATSLTINKLSREDVEAMLAAEQRALIRAALKQHFADQERHITPNQLEQLRLLALDGEGTPSPPGLPLKGRDNKEGVSPEGEREANISHLEEQEEADTIHGGDGPNPSHDSVPSQVSRILQGILSAEEETALIELLQQHHRINHQETFARKERITRTGFTLDEQISTVETALRLMGLRNFARLVLFCGHGSHVLNSPYESALDCGACGGNSGLPNARVLAAMANLPKVREGLARNGITIPFDTYFIAGEHNTATDEVVLVDLEDLPSMHRKDIDRLMDAVREAGLRTNQERLLRFPQAKQSKSSAIAGREVRRWSGNWSQVRPEWGLSSNAAFIIGDRAFTKGVSLEGRVFLNSYDYQEDATGQLLEMIMTGPQVVTQWINMEHYFSTVDNNVYGSGSKIYHNVVGRLGIMSGPQSDLRMGLSAETVMKGATPYHEPMRLLVVIQAPRERIAKIIPRHQVLQHYYDNEWVRLVAADPEENKFYLYLPHQGWTSCEPPSLDKEDGTPSAT